MKLWKGAVIPCLLACLLARVYRIVIVLSTLFWYIHKDFTFMRVHSANLHNYYTKKLQKWQYLTKIFLHPARILLTLKKQLLLQYSPLARWHLQTEKRLSLTHSLWSGSQARTRQANPWFDTSQLGKVALADIKKAVTYATAFGADYEARTRYLHLGKVALYQMS